MIKSTVYALTLSVFLSSSIVYSMSDTSVSDPNAALKDHDQRRLLLKKYAATQFKASNNHCKTFADVAHFAAGNVKKADLKLVDFMEDLRLVIIGADTFFRKKDKRGKYYMSVVTNSSGFKDNLADDSPQVEHAYAGIYFAKGFLSLMPGVSGGQGALVELLQGAYKLQSPSSADIQLYVVASDIGDRLSNSNFTQIKTPITRTMCK